MRLFLIVLLCLSELSAQSSAKPDDERGIKEAIESLEKHSKSPDELLDPTLAGETRAKSLSHLDDKLYQMSIYEKSTVQLHDDSRASMNARVHFKDGRTNADLPVTIQFVKRNGTWYFASYEFLGWPPFLIAVLVIGVGTALGYAAVVILIWARLNRAGKLDTAHMLLTMVPLAWPSLWRGSKTQDGAHAAC